MPTPHSSVRHSDRGPAVSSHCGEHWEDRVLPNHLLGILLAVILVPTPALPLALTCLSSSRFSPQSSDVCIYAPTPKWNSGFLKANHFQQLSAEQVLGN